MDICDFMSPERKNGRTEKVRIEEPGAKNEERGTRNEERRTKNEERGTRNEERRIYY